MFDDFFEKNPPINELKNDKTRSDNIKAAVLKGISEKPSETVLELYESEVKPMKKRNVAKTLIIAAAVAAIGTLSLVSANKITDGAITDGIKKVYNVIINGKEVEVEGTEYKYEDGDVFVFDYEVPEGEDGNQELIIEFNENANEAAKPGDTISFSFHSRTDSEENPRYDID